MKADFRISFAGLFLIVLLSSCETQSKKEERLAKKYCSSCHQFPDPAQIDKKTWEESVLPQMAFRMGVDMSLLFSVDEKDFGAVLPTIPKKPMVTMKEWESIRNYFITNAPDSLIQPVIPAEATLEQFQAKEFRLPVSTLPTTSMIKADTSREHLYVSAKTAKLYKFNFNFELKDSFQLRSPASAMLFPVNANPVITTIGMIDPNDQAQGEVSVLDEKNYEVKSIIDSLKRPSFVQASDLNNDNLDDYIVCAFGNYTGALLIYENLGNDQFKKHVVVGLPGSRKVIVRDFNDDGHLDILALLAQGDERILLFTNAGNFKFKTRALLRFPAVYGSSYFDLADFNNDGHDDILYTNGDNADYSIILKPYHGVRVFLNDGKNQFRENWFYPMYGASQALANDFDGDGDVDIAAISFFPDFAHNPERGFIYFENTGDGFKPYTTPLGSSGRWLVMETVDVESDGDTDILLGAYYVAPTPNNALQRQWLKDRTSILILKNNRFP